MNGQRPCPKDDSRQDVVKQILGNKTDTAVSTSADTKSLMGYAKGTCTAVNTTIPALHAVPTADATTNVYMRDVVGIKTDAAVTTVGTTKSIMAYVKGLITLVGALGAQTVPSANATDNTYSKDVIGNKTDTAVTTVATTKSLVGYAKGTCTAVNTTIPALHAVTGAADAAANTNMRDVIGRKDDTVAGDSIVALAKQIIVDTGTDIPASIAVIDAFHDVPAKDSTDDVVMSDVIGKKDDTAVTTVGTTKSVVAYVKGAITNTLNVLSQQNVPLADAADNSIVSDVVGNKTDTVAGDSLVALAKQIIVDTGTDIPAALAVIDAFHDVATADAATNAVMSDVIGNKEDAAVGTVTTTKSTMAYIKGILNDTEAMNANVDTILARETVVTSTKTLTAQGGGAGKVIDLFTLTGTVECLAIYGECTEATDSTTLTNLLLHLFPAGGAGVDITATGTDCAGLAVGDILRAVTSKATATQLLAVSGAVVDNAAWSPTILVKQTGVVTTIQAEYTSDASTDVDIKWTIRYRPLSADGAIAAA